MTPKKEAGAAGLALGFERWYSLQASFPAWSPRLDPRASSFLVSAMAGTLLAILAGRNPLNELDAAHWRCYAHGNRKEAPMGTVKGWETRRENRRKELKDAEIRGRDDENARIRRRLLEEASKLFAEPGEQAAIALLIHRALRTEEEPCEPACAKS